MKTTTLKNFGGLTYATVTNVPIKQSEFGEIIDFNNKELEVLVSCEILKNKIPIRGAEFRVLKSAISLSNEAISEKLGISRNTVLKWGKDIEKRLPLPYEMLLRILVADILGIKIFISIESLKAKNKATRINIKAA